MDSMRLKLGVELLPLQSTVRSVCPLAARPLFMTLHWMRACASE
jgi:hypothetical protein